jgi:ankyrin repeat protein
MCVSGNNTAWNRVLELIVSHYSVAELNDYIFRDGAFNCPHIAFASGSAPAVRIMLEKGVDANARTHSAVPLMPLQICAVTSSRASSDKWPCEVWATLLEYGTKAEAPTPPTDRSVVILDTQLLKLVLEDAPESADDNFNDTMLVAALHRMFGMVMTRHSLLLDSFRLALSCKSAARCVNRPDQHGLTMLQRAAAALHCEAVKMLLDAGANSSSPFVVVDEEVRPLLPPCHSNQFAILGCTGPPSIRTSYPKSSNILRKVNAFRKAEESRGE